jgi:transposase
LWRGLGIVRNSAWTAKLNDIDPRAWLADVLARLPDHPAKRIGELLPWNWKSLNTAAAAA